MKTPRAVRCVLLGAVLAAALGTASNAWGQRYRSSGKTPSEPAPTVELIMPSSEPSAASAVPPWQRPMQVPGSTPSAAPPPNSETPTPSAAPDGLDIQIDLPDPNDKARGDKARSDKHKDKAKADKAKADKAKADKARADKAKKPSYASRLAKSHASADSADAKAEGRGNFKGEAKAGGSAATSAAASTAGSTKKPWPSAGARRGPDEPESASLRDRIRRTRSENRDRTASLPPQASANLR